MTDISKTHLDHTIIFQEDNFRFRVEGSLFTGDSSHSRLFDSYENARAEITKRAEENAKVELRAANLNLAVVTEDGTPAHITKVNRQNSHLTGLDGRYVYPDLPWVREAVRQVAAAKAAQTKLEQIAIKIDRSFHHHGGKLSALAAEREYKRLPEEYAEKLRVATEQGELALVQDNIAS